MPMPYQQPPLDHLGMYYTQDARGRLQDFLPQRSPTAVSIGESSL
jgi:hypothetical protein